MKRRDKICALVVILLCIFVQFVYFLFPYIPLIV